MIPIIILLLFSLYNGLVIQWFNNKNKPNQERYSNLWHIVGWFIRLFIILCLPIRFIPLGIFVGWSIYNIGINLLLNKPIYYNGITFLDKYINKTIQIIIDCLLLIISILWML